jgi:hypothetical protein
MMSPVDDIQNVIAGQPILITGAIAPGFGIALASMSAERRRQLRRPVLIGGGVAIVIGFVIWIDAILVASRLVAYRAQVSPGSCHLTI